MAKIYAYGELASGATNDAKDINISVDGMISTNVNDGFAELKSEIDESGSKIEFVDTLDTGAVPRDADTLGGHVPSYYATNESLNQKVDGIRSDEFDVTLFNVTSNGHTYSLRAYNNSIRYYVDATLIWSK